MTPSETRITIHPAPPAAAGGRAWEASGIAQARKRSQDIDGRIRALFEARYGHDHDGWCITAVGGYGRQDLCPHSDIDLLIILMKRIPQADLQAILSGIIYPLWNEGLSASYSIRTIRQALSDCRSDFFFQTSLMDMRHLCGDTRVSDKLAHGLHKNLQGNRALRQFFSDLSLHSQKRHAKYGDASYILEPDLKDGQGGLRDYHGMLWLAQTVLDIKDPATLETTGIISSLDCRELERALDFLLRLRSRLHTLAERKNDRLHFEYQEIIAREFAFEGCRIKMAVETLMQDLHRSTLAIKSISTAVFTFCRTRLGLADSESPRKLGRDFAVASVMITFADPDPGRPEELITIFEPLAMHDYDLHPMARTFIRNNLNLSAKARSHPSAQRAFLKILELPYASKALTLMLELGVLEHFIPETEKIKGRIQYDVYHTYTVDMHSIHTTAHLKALAALEPEAFAHVRNPAVLFLAGFLHDIGKGHGRDHARTGAGIAYTIARRLDLPRESAELVRFLVLNHLILANTALRRDLSEEKVAFDCARTVQDAQRLSMLYLLTIADSKATGEAAWTDWKAALIKELYYKALMILLKGDLRDPRNVTRLEHKWEALIEHVGVEPAIQEAGGLWVLPQAYILAFDVPTIIEHLRFSGGILTLKDIHVHVAPQGAHFSLTVIARDRPGLIALLTGILASRHINIHTAKVFTWLNGLALDVFEVSPPWPDYDTWDQIAGMFRRIVDLEIDLAKALAGIRPLLKQQRKVCSEATPTVIIDNESSDFFTLIEVYAEDRIGLLHAITEALHVQGLNIHRAIITNKADLAADIFYVVDANGDKIVDEDDQSRIMAALSSAALHWNFPGK